MKNKMPRRSVLREAREQFLSWSRDIRDRYPRGEWRGAVSWDPRVKVEPEVEFERFMSELGHKVHEACDLWASTVFNIMISAGTRQVWDPVNPGYQMEAMFIESCHQCRAKVLWQAASGMWLTGEFICSSVTDRCRAVAADLKTEGQSLFDEGKRLHDEHIRQYEHDHRNRWQRLKDWWNARQVPEPSPPTP